jgi:YVTN family beta-propeller protein
VNAPLSGVVVANGSVVQSVPVGVDPGFMTFDGTNLRVPNHGSNSITVVQASTGAVVATLASNAQNRLDGPASAAFDGERILITNIGNDSVTVFRAADLGVIANVQLAAGTRPMGACSDGINFWVTLQGTRELVRL